MRDCATGIDGAAWLLSGAPEGITYNGSNSAEIVDSVLVPNLRRKVVGSIHRITGQSKSFRLIVFVDRPPCHLPEIESFPKHGQTVLVLTGSFRILTRNFRRLVPRDFCGGDHIVLLVGVSGGLHADS